MNVSLKNLVSMTEANQNFSKVARMVDENGAAVILKNNAPRYVVIDYSKLQEDEIADNESVEKVSKRILLSCFFSLKCNPPIIAVFIVSIDQSCNNSARCQCNHCRDEICNIFCIYRQSDFTYGIIMFKHIIK